MKTKNVLITALLSWLMIFTACNNDDNDVAITPTPKTQEEPKVTPEEEEANKPPSDFNLIGVTDQAVKVDVRPTFSWEASQDPEEDTVLYDLYLDTNVSPNTLYAADLTDTNFEVTERLSLLKKYNWKVVAKDSKGAKAESAVYGFETRGLRVTYLDNPEFRARHSHTSLVFDEKIWVIGGTDDNDRYNNDVWATTDGVQWSEATLNYQPPFAGRDDHASVVFDNRMWIIGGDNVQHIGLNDIWTSDNGLTWSEVTLSAPFNNTHAHTLVTFDNKLWFFGGWNGNSSAGTNSYLWQSDDGLNWTKSTSEAPFVARASHTSVVFDNKLWVIGGHAFGDQLGDLLNDVWYSSDGITWSLATAAAPFSKRSKHSTVVFDNKIWVIGGISDGNTQNDLWYSEDGVNWVETKLETSSLRRWGHTAKVFDQKIWVIGGTINNRSTNSVLTLD